jgi:hypothetical protein
MGVTMRERAIAAVPNRRAIFRAPVLPDLYDDRFRTRTVFHNSSSMSQSLDADTALVSLETRRIWLNDLLTPIYE